MSLSIEKLFLVFCAIFVNTVAWGQSASSELSCAARSKAVIANSGGIIANSNTIVDSYQSSLGQYGGANIGSHGDVQAATSITLNSGAVIHGATLANTPAGLQPLPPPSDARNIATFILNSGQSATLQAGDYVASSFTLNSSSSLTISGGQVRIWVTGGLILGGRANSRGLPGNLQFLVTGSQDVHVNSGASLYGVVYAPSASVLIDAPVFGSVVGSQVVLVNSGGQVHYDQQSACLAVLQAEPPNISIWPDTSVSATFPITNVGEAAAENVTVTGVSISAGATLPVVSYPVVIGTIVPDAQHSAQAVFSVPAIDGRTYTVTIVGTYVTAAGTVSFSLNSSIQPVPENNNPISSVSGTSLKSSAANATFPPQPPDQDEIEANPPDFAAPVGPARDFFVTPPSSTAIGMAPLIQSMATQNPGIAGTVRPKDSSDNSNAVVFARNTIFGSGGTPPDPTVAGTNGDDVAMAASNTAIYYSVNGGQSYTQVNLASGFSDPANPGRSSFFPQNDGGLCCDQVLTYVPNQDIFVWLLQYKIVKGTQGPNRLRIAWATSQGVKNDFLHAWTWVDLTSARVPNVDDGVGLGTDWMDFPDLTFSNNFVFVSADHAFGTNSVRPDRRVFVRLSLADMVDTSSSVVHYSYMEPTRSNLFKSHYAQQSQDAGLWACPKDTSTLSVFVWPDNSDKASVHDVGITRYNSGDSAYNVVAPDGMNWNTAPRGVLGGTVTTPARLCPPDGCPASGNRFVYFAFTAGQNGSGRPFPYVRVEKIDRDTMGRASELDIWNPGFAFATPALNSSVTNTLGDEVAISLATGGGGNYANNAVGFLGDFMVFTTGSSDTTQSFKQFDDKNRLIVDSNNNPILGTRFGDYYSVRNAIGPVTPNGRGVGYSTLGYEVKTAVSGQTCGLVGCNIKLHYVLFGRESALFPQPIIVPK